MSKKVSLKSRAIDAVKKKTKRKIRNRLIALALIACVLTAYYGYSMLMIRTTTDLQMASIIGALQVIKSRKQKESEEENEEKKYSLWENASAVQGQYDVDFTTKATITSSTSSITWDTDFSDNNWGRLTKIVKDHFNELTNYDFYANYVHGESQIKDKVPNNLPRVGVDQNYAGANTNANGLNFKINSGTSNALNNSIQVDSNGTVNDNTSDEKKLRISLTYVERGKTKACSNLESYNIIFGITPELAEGLAGPNAYKFGDGNNNFSDQAKNSYPGEVLSTYNSQYGSFVVVVVDNIKGTYTVCHKGEEKRYEKFSLDVLDGKLDGNKKTNEVKYTNAELANKYNVSVDVIKRLGGAETFNGCMLGPVPTGGEIYKLANGINTKKGDILKILLPTFELDTTGNKDNNTYQVMALGNGEIEIVKVGLTPKYSNNTSSSTSNTKPSTSTSTSNTLPTNLNNTKSNSTEKTQSSASNVKIDTSLGTTDSSNKTNKPELTTSLKDYVKTDTNTPKATLTTDLTEFMNSNTETISSESPKFRGARDGNSEMYVYFLGTERSTSVLVTCGGKTVLLDTGLDKDSAKRVYDTLDKIGEDTIDLVILSHGHGDHTGGMQTITSDMINGSTDIKISEAAYHFGNMSMLSAYYTDGMISNAGISKTRISTGWKRTIGDMELECVCGNEEKDTNADSESVDVELVNNQSLVIKITLKGTNESFLFGGDITNSKEASIISSGKDVSCSLMLLNHHGTSSANSQEYLNACGAKYAVVTTGTSNGVDGRAQIDANLRTRCDKAGTEFRSDFVTGSNTLSFRLSNNGTEFMGINSFNGVTDSSSASNTSSTGLNTSVELSGDLNGDIVPYFWVNAIITRETSGGHNFVNTSTVNVMDELCPLLGSDVQGFNTANYTKDELIKAFGNKAIGPLQFIHSSFFNHSRKYPSNDLVQEVTMDSNLGIVRPNLWYMPDLVLATVSHGTAKITGKVDEDIKYVCSSQKLSDSEKQFMLAFILNECHRGGNVSPDSAAGKARKLYFDYLVGGMEDGTLPYEPWDMIYYEGIKSNDYWNLMPSGNANCGGVDLVEILTNIGFKDIPYSSNNDKIQFNSVTNSLISTSYQYYEYIRNTVYKDSTVQRPSSGNVDYSGSTGKGTYNKELMTTLSSNAIHGPYWKLVKQNGVSASCTVDTENGIGYYSFWGNTEAKIRYNSSGKIRRFGNNGCAVYALDMVICNLINQNITVEELLTRHLSCEKQIFYDNGQMYNYFYTGDSPCFNDMNCIRGTLISTACRQFGLDYIEIPRNEVTNKKDMILEGLKYETMLWYSTRGSYEWYNGDGHFVALRDVDSAGNLYVISSTSLKGSFSHLTTPLPFEKFVTHINTNNPIYLIGQPKDIAIIRANYS